MSSLPLRHFHYLLFLRMKMILCMFVCLHIKRTMVQNWKGTRGVQDKEVILPISLPFSSSPHFTSCSLLSATLFALSNISWMPVTQYEHIITHFNQSLVDEHYHNFLAIRSNATMTFLVPVASLIQYKEN